MRNTNKEDLFGINLKPKISTASQIAVSNYYKTKARQEIMLKPPQSQLETKDPNDLSLFTSFSGPHKSQANRHLEQRLETHHIDIGGLKEILPCCIEAVDDLSEMFVSGTSKLQQEVNYAFSIPQKERRLLNKKMVNIQS